MTQFLDGDRDVLVPALQDPGCLISASWRRRCVRSTGATSRTTVLMSVGERSGSVSWMSETISDSCCPVLWSATSNLLWSGTPDGCPERTEITDRTACLFADGDGPGFWRAAFHRYEVIQGTFQCVAEGRENIQPHSLRRLGSQPVASARTIVGPYPRRRTQGQMMDVSTVALNMTFLLTLGIGFLIFLATFSFSRPC
jgi:hypothetical protein